MTLVKYIFRHRWVKRLWSVGISTCTSSQKLQWSLNGMILIFIFISMLDTGHGTLYTSDSSGIIFSESLEQHLYPNYRDITDFYRVQSIRGTYLASQLAGDKSIHTVITFNRGANWHNITRPVGAPCKDEKKVRKVFEPCSPLVSYCLG